MNTAITRAKASAKRLRARLNELGATLSHTQSLEAVAACQAGTDWNRYRASLERPSLPPATAWAPPWFIFSNPGEGGWFGMRIHDMLALHRQPEKTAIWVYPAFLDSERFLNSLDLTVFIDSVALSRLDKAGWDDLAERTRGKILMVHAPPSFRTPEEHLEAVSSTVSALRASVLWEQALSLTFLDIHFWCRPGNAADAEVLRPLSKSSGVLLRFHTGLLSTLDQVSTFFPLRALGTSSRAARELMAWSEDDARRVPFGVQVGSLGRAIALDPDRLDTLEGCLAYVSRNVSPRPYAREEIQEANHLVSKDARMAMVLALLADEHARWTVQHAADEAKKRSVEESTKAS